MGAASSSSNSKQLLREMRLVFIGFRHCCSRGESKWWWKECNSGINGCHPQNYPLPCERSKVLRGPVPAWCLAHAPLNWALDRDGETPGLGGPQPAAPKCHGRPKYVGTMFLGMVVMKSPQRNVLQIWQTCVWLVVGGVVVKLGGNRGYGRALKGGQEASSRTHTFGPYHARMWRRCTCSSCITIQISIL